MKDFLLKLLGTFLAILIVFASFSFTVTAHYCNNKKVAVSYVSNKESCKSNTSKNNCKKTCNVSLEKNFKTTCCKTDVTFVKGIIVVTDFLDKQVKTASSYNILPSVIVNPIYSFSSSKEYTDTNYFSPNIKVDFQTNFQVFLI